MVCSGHSLRTSKLLVQSFDVFRASSVQRCHSMAWPGEMAVCGSADHGLKERLAALLAWHGRVEEEAGP